MIGRPYDEMSLKARMKKSKIADKIQAQITPGNFAVVAFTAGRGLGEILRQANQVVGFDLWPQAETVIKSSGTVSDYVPFAAAQVPCLYLGGGAA